jgi:hypothetical protein
MVAQSLERSRSVARTAAKLEDLAARCEMGEKRQEIGCQRVGLATGVLQRVIVVKGQSSVVERNGCLFHLVNVLIRPLGGNRILAGR